MILYLIGVLIMSFCMISNKQLSVSVLAIIITIIAAVAFTKITLDYFDLPEVWMSVDGKCVKVVNFKNGDGYNCQDKDVVLRKYLTVITK